MLKFLLLAALLLAGAARDPNLPPFPGCDPNLPTCGGH